MWRVTGSGWHCERIGPNGGLNGVRGAMFVERIDNEVRCEVCLGWNVVIDVGH